MATLYKAIGLGVVTGVVGLVIHFVVFQIVFKDNLDIYFLFRLRGEIPAPHDVAIISMDRYSADKLNLPYNPKKWPRSLHAQLLENLKSGGAKVVAFDIMFREMGTPEDDDLFAKAIEKSGNVVLCESLKREMYHLTDETGFRIGSLSIEKLEQANPSIAQSAVALAPFPVPKVPSKVSHYWAFKTSAGDMPTLPVVTFQIYALNEYDKFIKFLNTPNSPYRDKLPAGKDEIRDTRCVVKIIRVLREMFQEEFLLAENMLERLRSETPLSLDVKEEQIFKSLIHMYTTPASRYINFYGPPRSITTIPYYHALQFSEPFDGNEERIDFKGKAVFVGSDVSFYPGQRDGFSTIFSPSGESETSGVEIAATAFANLLEASHLRSLGLHTHFGVTFVWGMLLGILCYLLSPLISALSAACASVLYLAVALYQFQTHCIWYPLVVPLFCQAPIAFLGGIGWRIGSKNKEFRKIRRALRYHLPNQTVDLLSKGIRDIEVHNKPVYGTCLYTDTDQCSLLLGDMNAKERKRFFSKYYRAVNVSIKKHGGAVTYLKEDYMLSLWMDINTEAVTRAQACCAALDIGKVLHRLNYASNSGSLAPGIGLHSGQIILAPFAALDHYGYGSVEELDSTATKIEGLNKYLGTHILLSENVVKNLDSFLTREVGRFMLAYNAEPVTIHELLGFREDAHHQQRRLCLSFSEALDTFKRQLWDDSEKRFDELIKRFGADGPSLFYQNLSKRYRNSSFEESWNGLICMGRENGVNLK